MASTTAMFRETTCANCGAGRDRQSVVFTTHVTHACHLYGAPISIAACRDCGLVFMNPRPTKESIERLYAEELYRDAKTGGPSRKNPNKVTIADLFGVLRESSGQPLSGLRVLDVGANEGRWLALFDRSNTRVGIEPSSAALRPCSDDIRLIRSDLESVPLSEPFDLVTATALIEHLYDPLEGLIKMNALLKPGGRLFLYTPDIKGLMLRRGASKYFKIVHLYYFSIATLASLLQKAGFEVEATRVFEPRFSDPRRFPQTGTPGNFSVLARKVASVTCAQAREAPASTGREEYDLVVKRIADAARRDRWFSQISATLNRTRMWRNRASGALKARYPHVWLQMKSVLQAGGRRPR